MVDVFFAHGKPPALGAFTQRPRLRLGALAFVEGGDVGVGATRLGGSVSPKS